MTARVTRANGEASRRKILDAALEIAGERGYSGTSISEVSKRSGLPNSSIYWHFKDKDALFAAVIEDSFERWGKDFNERIRAPRSSPSEVVDRLHESLSSFPAFLRFGHLVVLEQHELELGARSAFLRIRRESLAGFQRTFQEELAVSASTAKELAALALALVDGAFIARVAGENTLSKSGVLGRMFEACLNEAIRTSKSK
jgi:AcrR family transcriptional regulator